MRTGTQLSLRPWLQSLFAACFIVLALFRITATYPVLNQVYDEPFTISCGMEWLDHHVYRHDPKHPPLGRVVAALPLYLSGLHSSDERDPRIEGTKLLGTGATYWRNLSLSRAALLPFFVLLCITVWRWATWLGGATVGLTALFILTNTPPILGNAALAMTDVPLAATVATALYCFSRWLESPGLWRTLLLGICGGLAILSKFTALVFLGACCPVILALFLIQHGPQLRSRHFYNTAIVVALAALLIWGGYRFSFHPYGIEKTAAHVSGFDVPDWNPPAPVTQSQDLFGYLRYKAQVISIPAPEFFVGLGQLWRHNHEPEPNYFLGEASFQGWSYHYPVVFAVKTPLAIFLLCAIGIYAIRKPDWRILTPLALIVTLFGVGLLSHVNTGVRHLLLVYPALALLGSLGIPLLLRTNESKFILGLLLCSLMIESGFAHPDYMAWFNAAVDGKSGEFGVDTDLDYGQDLARLADECRARSISNLKLSYHGTAAPEAFGLASYQALEPGKRERGWVAISVYNQKLGGQAFTWLEDHRPLKLIGSSIRLYYIQ